MPEDDVTISDEELNHGLSRLETIAANQRKERRWWRVVIVLGIILAAITVTSSVETRRNVEEMRAEADARCERGNLFRSEVERMGQADQDRWDSVTSVLRLEDAPDDTPERRAFKEQFRSALKRSHDNFAEALAGVAPVDCGVSAVTTTTTSFVP